MEAEALRDEAAEWLATHWTGERSDAFLESVIDAKLAAPSWPVEWYGRGVAPEVGQVVAEEFAKVGPPPALAKTSPTCGPTPSWRSAPTPSRPNTSAT